jgi:hypothetical protein
MNTMKISILSPNDGDIWKKTNIHKVYWEHCHCSNITLWASKNNRLSFMLLGTSTASDCSLEVDISDLPCSENYILKLVGNGCCSDIVHIEITD